MTQHRMNQQVSQKENLDPSKKQRKAPGQTAALAPWEVHISPSPFVRGIFSEYRQAKLLNHAQADSEGCNDYANGACSTFQCFVFPALISTESSRVSQWDARAGMAASPAGMPVFVWAIWHRQILLQCQLHWSGNWLGNQRACKLEWNYTIRWQRQDTT